MFKLPDVTGISASARQKLAHWFLTQARLEHVSIATFSELSLQLMAEASPPGLLENCHRAAMNEVDHAEACYAFASAYSGVVHEAGALPEAGVGLEKKSVRTLLEEALVHGVLGEGLAASLAHAASGSATDPNVKTLLARIARDEATHAAHALDLAAWLISRDPTLVEVAAQLANRFSEVDLAGLPIDDRIVDTHDPDREVLLAHGFLDRDHTQTLTKQVFGDAATHIRAMLQKTHRSH